MDVPAPYGLGEDPGLDASDIAQDAPDQVERAPDLSTLENPFEEILEAAEPVLKRIERGAQTGNPVGLNGKECVLLFNFVMMQASQHTTAGVIIAGLEEELMQARQQQGDWKTDNSGLVVPT